MDTLASIFSGICLWTEYSSSSSLRAIMKGALMTVSDRLLLRKCAIIETIDDELKNLVQIEHSRHRCFDNFIVNTRNHSRILSTLPKAMYQCTMGIRYIVYNVLIHRTHVVL